MTKNKGNLAKILDFQKNYDKNILYFLKYLYKNKLSRDITHLDISGNFLAKKTILLKKNWHLKTIKYVAFNFLTRNIYKNTKRFK